MRCLAVSPLVFAVAPWIAAVSAAREPPPPPMFATGTTAAGSSADTGRSARVLCGVEPPDAMKSRQLKPATLVPDERGGLRSVIRFELKDAVPGAYRFVGRVEVSDATRGVAFDEPFTVVAGERPAGAAKPLANPELAEVLYRAGRYVVEYEKSFSNIVAEEEYVRRSRCGSRKR